MSPGEERALLQRLAFPDFVAVDPFAPARSILAHFDLGADL